MTTQLPLLPFSVSHAGRFIGVFWAVRAKNAAEAARAESDAFGPISLIGKRLVVVPFTEAMKTAFSEAMKNV